MPFERAVLHWRLHCNQDHNFKVSRLFYAAKKHTQYQVIVKLLGSFRLTAGNRHLHRYCIFTELFPETVPQSLRHSCTSELTRQGISLGSPSISRLMARTLSSLRVRRVRRLVSEDSDNL